jgi:hypothetical protein
VIALWRAKMAAKILLSRLPVRYGAWRRMSLFKHGAMEDPDYAIRVFESHFETTSLAGSRGFVCMELGPGDSVGSAIIANAYGADRCYLIDVGPFARTDMAPYAALVAMLRDRGLSTIDLGRLRTVSDILQACRAVYLTDGLSSLRQVPAASVDFSWSHAVLEHVDRSLFDVTIRELRRVISDTGVSSHRVDLEDHLANSLNHLRFSHARWESPLFKRSGFYTNRLRSFEILRACEAAGFKVERWRAERWDRPPVARRHLAVEFRSLSEDELRMRAVDLVLTTESGQFSAQSSAP